jgi:hypothetical protein
MKRHAVQTCRVERRLSVERRSFAYSNHIPERRSGRDRRDTSVTAADIEAHASHHGQPAGKERAGVFKIVSAR